MADFDFQNAQPPKLLPLNASFAQNDLEAELKLLAQDLFAAHCAKRAFDANVQGMSHLGSFELVQKLVNADGLSLMPGAMQEAAMRYLYRAWKSRGQHGRGLHFLRTYLQMLFPNQCDVEQLWQDVLQPYPLATYALKPSETWWLPKLGEPGLRLDGVWKVGGKLEGLNEPRQERAPDASGMFLTSRIRINMSFDVQTHNVRALLQIVRNVIPARFVPEFRFWLHQVFSIPLHAQYQLCMSKEGVARYPWCGRVIAEDWPGRWKLGRDAESVKLPQPFGRFKVGEKRGAIPAWKLKSCRAAGHLQAQLQGEVNVRPREVLALDPVLEYSSAVAPPKLFNRPRRIDGSWRLGGAHRLGSFKLDGSVRLGAQKMREISRFGTFKIQEHKPPRPAEPKRARLTLSGRWKLGGRRNPVFEFFTIKKGAAHA